MGQNNWNSQGTGVNDYVVQAAINRQLYSEVREADAFGTMELLDPDAPNSNGLQAATSVSDVSGTGAILTQEVLSKTDEARFTLRRNIRGEASYGDTQPGAGDTFSFLHQNIKINEVDSKWIPVIGRQSQRRIGGLILDHKGPVLEAIKDWHIEERSFDIHEAIFEGADYGQRGTAEGCLGEVLGVGSDPLAAGVGAPIEHFYTPLTGSKKAVIPAAGPRSNAYRANVIADLDALAGDNSKYANRDTLAAIAQFANDLKIRKVSGGDWDYELVVDPAIMDDLLATDSDLMALYKTAQQGQGTAGQKSLDVRGAINIDGLRIVPDAGMKKWRPKGTGTVADGGLGDGVLIYGDGSRDRREKTFVGDNYRIGFMVLMGKGGLLHSTDGALETITAEDEAKKGWKAYGRINRGFKRSLWLAKDGTTIGASTGWLNQSMLCVAMNIRTSRSLT